jgi:hypothetical protein
MNEMERSQLEAAMEDAREQFAQAGVKFGEILRAAAILLAPKLAQAGRDLNAALDVERRVLGFMALGVDAMQARAFAEAGHDPDKLAQLQGFLRSLAEPAAEAPVAEPMPARNENPKRKRWESPRWQPKGRR